MAPKEGLTAKEERELTEKLAAYKAGLSAEELAQIVADTKALRTYQEEEEAPEKLALIPMLKREDMKKEAEDFVNEVRNIGDTKILFHEIQTNGIGYI